jgi:hypothetical protein
MTTEIDYHDGSCAQGISRSGFLKLAATAGLLVVGCNAKPEPTATPTSKPTVPPTIMPTSAPTAIPTYSAEDFSRMAYCGIRCWSACPEHAYPKSCEGCKSSGGILAPYCQTCAIRKCASEKQVLTCAHCQEYPSCTVETWTIFPVLRKKIDQIRSDLQNQS